MDKQTIDIKELKDLIKDSERYRDFVIFDEPVVFCEYFKDDDADIVQLHSIQTCDTLGGKKFFGFCGVCTWFHNKLTPRDGDSYTEKMLIYGYDWFKTEGGGCGLDVLVGSDW